MSKTWDEPVIVEDHLIFTPHQASQFLRANRKNQEQEHGLDPERILAAAIDGRVPPDVAREAFLQAVGLSQS